MLAHGRLFLATPGELPDCMKVQSGFLCRAGSFSADATRLSLLFCVPKRRALSSGMN